MTLGHAGYKSRPVRPDDPLVCQLCGRTLGERRLQGDALARVVLAHGPDCKRAMKHQQWHRQHNGPCPDCKAAVCTHGYRHAHGTDALDHGPTCPGPSGGYSPVFETMKDYADRIKNGG